MSSTGCGKCWTDMENRAPALSPAAAAAGWWWMAFQYLLLPKLLGLLMGDMGSAFANFCYHLVCFAAVSLIFHRYLLESLQWACSRWKNCALVIAAGLVAFYASGWAVKSLIALVEPGFANQNDGTMLRYFGEHFALTVLATVVLAPVSEELLFRGLLFANLRGRSRWGAYALSSLCFASIHVLGYLGTYTPVFCLLALVQYLPAGLILACSAEKSQTMAVPILIHMVINAVSVISIL